MNSFWFSSAIKSATTRHVLTTRRCFATKKDNRLDLERVRQQIIQEWINSQASSPQGAAVTARYCTFTYFDGVREYKKHDAPWFWLDRELSSNLTGETGAVSLYKGALAALNVTRNENKQALDFCREHMANEAEHLRLFESIVPAGKHTRLLPVWRLAGWTLGFVPTALGGPKALYVTVEAVETFVEEHFQEQIIPLKERGGADELVRLLEHCCADEVHHKQDAVQKLIDGDPDFDAWWVKPWSRIVGKGSALAAEVARRV